MLFSQQKRNGDFFFFLFEKKILHRIIHYFFFFFLQGFRNMFNKVNYSATVALFIIIPSNQFDKGRT